MSDDKIAKIRKKIDQADAQIIDALAFRLELIQEIANYKKIEAIHDAQREKELITKAIILAEQKNIDPEFIKNLYTEILNNSKKEIKNILQK